VQIVLEFFDYGIKVHTPYSYSGQRILSLLEPLGVNGVKVPKVAGNEPAVTMFDAVAARTVFFVSKVMALSAPEATCTPIH
jgi:hypothetical protein